MAARMAVPVMREARREAYVCERGDGAGAKRLCSGVVVLEIRVEPSG
jgi:hypothetical protein